MSIPLGKINTSAETAEVDGMLGPAQGQQDMHTMWVNYFKSLMRSVI